MKPISIKPLTSSIVEAANNISRDMGIVQPNGNAQEVGSGVLPIHAGAGKVSPADVETALKTAQAALEAAEAALEAAKNAQKDVTDLETDVNNKQDTLVSGENIKTVNGMTVLGAGNIVINPTIMDLRWTTNVATTRKLVPAELRKKGVKIAYRDNNSVYHVEQYQAEDIDDESWENDVNWKGCRTPLTPLFENAGATFNDETGFYEMNELTDLTENDCYMAYKYYRNNAMTNSYSGMWQMSKIRTNFPIEKTDSPYPWNFAYRDCNNLEIARPSLQSSVTATSVSNIIGACYKLRKVLTIFRLFGNYTSDISITGTLNVLSYFKVQYLHNNLRLLAPMIGYESVRYWVDNADNTKEITITVHPTTYGYLTGTIEPTEQVGGTKEEWMQIVTDAQAKQISFATTE